MRACSLALMAVVLAGCPKQVDSRVAVTDDTRIDSAMARLEEYQVRGQQEDLSCDERCELGTQTCAEAGELCGWVERNPDRENLAPKCVEAREQCAQSGNGCKRCREQ